MFPRRRLDLWIRLWAAYAAVLGDILTISFDPTTPLTIGSVFLILRVCSMFRNRSVVETPLTAVEELDDNTLVTLLIKGFSCLGSDVVCSGVVPSWELEDIGRIAFCNSIDDRKSSRNRNFHSSKDFLVLRRDDVAAG